MSSFLQLRGTVHSHGCCVDALIHAMQTATREAQREATAAAKIQSVARMASQRRKYLSVQASIIDIQRCFRGYLGRKRFLREKIATQIRYNEAIFNHFATVIQSRIRGFLLRKKHCDFYARQRYIKDVSERSEAVRAEAQSYFETQRKLHEETQHAAQLAEFRQATKNMHHLLSTATVSGVYRPPLTVEGARTVFGTNIEDDLRAIPRQQGATSKRKFKPDLPVAKLQTTSSSGTPSDSKSPCRPSYVPHAPPVGWNAGIASLGVSLQNAAPYEKTREYSALEAAVDKKLQDALHQRRFLARKPDPIRFEKSIAADSKYVEKSTIRH